MGGIGSGRPTKEGKKLPEMDTMNMTPARKKQIVENLHSKHYSQVEIADKTGLTKKEVASAVRSIMEENKKNRVNNVGYYRNMHRKTVSQAISRANDIVDADNNVKYPQLRLRGLQVLGGLIKLAADIDGVTSDKQVQGVDRKAADLLGELKKATAEANLGKKTKEVIADADAEQTAGGFDSEQDSVTEERQGGDGVTAIGTTGSDNL